MSVELTDSKQAAVWKQVVAILQAAMALPNTTPGNLAYVQALWQGTRDNVPLLPAIILEIDTEKESNRTVPLGKLATMSIAIQVWSSNYGNDTQIIGDAPSIGIMDFVRDVKNAINAHPNLDLAGNAAMIRFPETRYTTEAWPNRMADITLEVDYICQSTTR